MEADQPESRTMAHWMQKQGKGTRKMSQRIATKAIRIAHVPLRMLVILGMLLGMIGMFAPATQAAAAEQTTSTTSASFSGGSGTALVGTTLYAKQGATVTLTVTTSVAAKCVVLTGAHALTQTSADAKTQWTFAFTAGAGEGLQSVTADPYRNYNDNKCLADQDGNKLPPATAGYTLDNTGPTVTGALSPTPNAAGWNNGDVMITWSATDNGAGVGSGPTPATDSVTEDTTGVTKTATATDLVGNSGSGSVTVKLDETAPTISGSRTAANANGWNNTDVTVSFACDDATSGIKSCPDATTLSAEGAGQSVSGTATDNADNSASKTVSGISIDKTAPSLSGAPTAAPNGSNGWYTGDVTIAWTCGDALSGIDGACPTNSTIAGEGTGLTASAAVSDRAGNQTNATSSPAVKIDRTAPNTTATAPANWNNDSVTVSLTANDALSGVAATHYKLNGGTQQTGTSVTISAEGIHTLQFWSEDNAGNVEAVKSVQVKIDKTKPTINHTQSPAANGNGWNNTDVTVTFTCGDALSGIASCTAAQTITTEGKDQLVTGTAVDNAGNTATDPATVSIDKTTPTITGGPDRAANSNGWYKANVTVSFTCDDALSGIASCTGPQTLGEGVNQSVIGTATDAADNSAEKTVSGINIDKTAPTLSGAPTAAPNGSNGWYTGDVTIDWTCGDALSGLDGACPADSTITGEGTGLTASAAVSDRAGNTTNATSPAVKIDRTAPSTSAGVSGTQFGGWYTGTVQVTLEGLDSLSGVDKTHYSVNGGAQQTYTGAFNLSQSGTYAITFWSVDNAGNVEDKTAARNSVTLQIDNTEPTIIGTATPEANANGWNKTDVTVSFTCTDAHSGVKSCPSATTLTAEGANQSVNGTATDNAGNTASVTVVVNIDKTAPALSGAPTTSPNAAGWYNTNVTVAWACSDAHSGIAGSCPADSTISSEGTGLTASASVQDQAGNTTSATSSPAVNLDKTAPTVGTPTFSVNPKAVNESTVLSATAGDALSGVAGGEYFFGTNDPGVGSGTAMALSGSTLSATIGTSLLPGVYTANVRSQDRAGNWSTVSTGYLVVYDPNGGFVTGGGWIMSPLGAYAPDPKLEGRANFGFVSKYQKGATVPTGQTEFQFKVGNLNFKSTAYEWLVVSGAKAQYKGTGTINGAGEYGFMLTSTDGQLDGTGIDKFRIKIWDKATGKVVYDNQMEAADDAALTTAISGGQIHIKK